MSIERVTDHFVFVKASTPDGLRLDGTYLHSSGTWRVPLNLGALRDLYRAGYDVEELGKKLNTLYKSTAALKEQATLSDMQIGLREYQSQDVNFLINVPYAGVFNQQRTGKSPTMCRVLQLIDKDALLIVPASLMLNWRDELHRWAPGMTVHLAVGTKARRRKVYDEYKTRGGVLIASRGIARSDTDELAALAPKVMIVDEAHFLRNYKTAQSLSIYKIAQHTQRRYALTGTAATKHPSDVYGILQFLNQTAFPSYWQFVERYFTVKDGFFGGKDIGKFKSKEREKEYLELLNVLSVQRKRKDVMQWLPAKQYSTVRLAMDGKQKKAYTDMLETFEVEELELDTSTVLAQLTRLRQLTTAPNTLGLRDPGAKIEYILEWLEDNPDEPVVIFSNFSSALKELHSVLKVKAELVIGETSKEKRHKAVKQFQAGKVQVLLCNIEAAGTGLTMDTAGTVIFMDRHYNPADNEQAEDRIVATQKDRNLNALIIDLVCEGSVDEKIIEIVRQKKSVTEVANNYKNMKAWLK